MRFCLLTNFLTGQDSKPCVDCVVVHVDEGGGTEEEGGGGRKRSRSVILKKAFLEIKNNGVCSYYPTKVCVKMSII